MTKQKESVLSNAKIAIIFFAILLFFVALSLIFKLILIIGQGQFDDSRRFTLNISNNKKANVLSLSPSTKSIAQFELNKNLKPAEAGRLLEIPIDGFITSNSLELNQKVNSLFFSSILNYNNLQTNLTIIDLLKLFAFAATVPQTSINVKNIPQDLSGTQVDKIVGKFTSDEFIEKDNQTIQIINGTRISGLGNRLARLITNIGGDVIIVATSDVPRKKSTISYIDKKTYTVERLSKVLGYEIIKEDESAISDITIVIGEDKVSSSPF